MPTSTNEVLENQDEEIQTADLETSDEETQTENENSAQQNDSETDPLQEAMKKYNASSPADLVKKLENQESHIGKLEQENKHFRELTAKSVDVLEKAKASDDPSVTKVSDVLNEVLSPYVDIAIREQTENQDKQALASFIEQNPAAKPFEAKLWEKGKKVALQYNEIWALMEDAWSQGMEQGSNILDAKMRASAGGVTSIAANTSTGKPKLTPEQIEFARKCGNEPSVVYK